MLVNIFINFLHCTVSKTVIRYVPVVFALLPNKTVHTYSKLFEHMNLECSTFGFSFNPIKFVVGFENGIHLASFFHLKQAWYKKMLKLG
jgi:hypothetical protein